MDAPERFEQLIAYLNSNLQAPVDRQEDDAGSIQFIGGEPAEVVALLTPTSVIVSEFAGVWETPFKFRAIELLPPTSTGAVPVMRSKSPE